MFERVAVTVMKINIGPKSSTVKAIKKNEPVLEIILNFDMSSFSEVFDFKLIKIKFSKNSLIVGKTKNRANSWPG